jgi:hypothetical protein
MAAVESAWQALAYSEAYQLKNFHPWNCAMT